jgi:hypothetical protein
MSVPKNILVLSDYISATQIISFLQPLANSIATGDLRLRMEPHSTKAGVMENIISEDVPEFLIMSRYTWSKGKSLTRLARKIGAAILYHIDDNLLDVPIDLGEAKFSVYNDPKTRKNLHANMEVADLLYASTPALAKVFEGYNLDVPIVGGDLYCSVGAEQILASAPSTMPTIGYMGTGGHSADLASILPAIEFLMDELPLLRFETFGSILRPPSLGRFGSRYMHHEPVPNYVEFRQRLSSLGWWIGLAPLENTPFNCCKADTKWVEYSAAGMATVASDLLVYRKACSGDAGVLASSVDDWKSALTRLIYDHNARQNYIVNAQAKLRRMYGHNNLELQLMQVFEMARANAAQRKPNAKFSHADAG